MRFAHISDLHLGKRLGNYTLIEDQRYILDRIADIVTEKECSGVLIAGDIYDKSTPSAEAVKLFNEFLTKLCKAGKKVYIVSGNHDNPERVNYASEIMAVADIHICAGHFGEIKVVKAEDEYGGLDICLLPFIKPSYIRERFPDSEINDYTDMMRTVLENSGIDRSRRCVLVCHQFITGAKTCDSEYISVGTLDNIDAGVFDGFDYVALGHIHNPQEPAKNVRYCGTPLKYSSSEISHTKSVTIIDLKEKNNVEVTTEELVPMRDLIPLKEKYEVLTSKSFYSKLDLDAFYYITLTDDTETPYVMAKLRTIYKNIVQLGYDNERTRSTADVGNISRADNKTPYELFSALFKEQFKRDLTEEQQEYIKQKIDRIWGDDE